MANDPNPGEDGRRSRPFDPGDYRADDDDPLSGVGPPPPPPPGRPPPGPAPVDPTPADPPPTVEPTESEPEIRLRTPAQPAGSAEPRAAAGATSDDDDSGVIIGPSQSGKTVVLSALQQASLKASRKDFLLRFIAHDRELLERCEREGAAQQAGSIAAAEVQLLDFLRCHRALPPGATHGYQDYLFSIEAVSGLRDPRLKLRVRDGRGGALFREEFVEFLDRVQQSPSAALEADRKLVPEEWHTVYQPMRTSIQRANHLVICVDAERPKKSLLRRNLPGLLSDVVVDTEIPRFPDLGWVDRMRMWFRDADRTVIRPRLKATRVLILFTKVDRVAAVALARHQKAVGASADALTPAKVADRIDPIAFARDRLDDETLKLILDRIRPGATLAVGLCSAYGFRSDDGQPLIGIDNKPSRTSRDEAEKIQSLWTPFGLGQALRYLLAGDEGGPVRILREQHLHGTPGRKYPFGLPEDS